MEHPHRKFLHLPRVCGDGPPEPPEPVPPKRPGIFPCPCCGCRTFPAPPAEAIAYICPVCMWENDVFLTSDDEPSDENHGLTLNRARENFRLRGVCDPRLAQYARPPCPEELPEDGKP